MRSPKADIHFPRATVARIVGVRTNLQFTADADGVRRFVELLAPCFGFHRETAEDREARDLIKHAMRRFGREQ